MSGILATIINENKNTMEFKTPLHLVYGPSDDHFRIAEADGTIIADNGADHAEYQPVMSIETAQRFIACVNACAGIPSDKLEGKTIGQYVAHESYVTGVKDGKIGLEGIGASLIANQLAGMLVGSAAPNYLELTFNHPETGDITVTIQRMAGKTPHQLRRRAEEQRALLLASLYKALPFVEDHEENPVYKPGAVKACVKTIREAIDAAEKGAA